MKILMALGFMIMLQVLTFWAQTSVDVIAMEGDSIAPQFFNYDGSLIKEYDTGNYTADENVSGLLPTGQAQIEPDSGNFFTDTFSTIKNWFLDIPGVNVFVNFLNAFPNMLKGMGLPPEISFGLGIFWHLLMLLLLILVLKGNY